VEIYTWPQQSPQWFQCKLGIPSAGSFSKILAKGQGKTRKTYMLKLAADIITEEHRETYQNPHMERGNTQEDAARDEYSLITGRDVSQVGFIKKGRIGCSPDGLVGAEGGIEVKCVIPEVQIETVMANKIPPGHISQIQGNIWICELEWMDFASYSPLIKNSNYMFIKRAYRDEKIISNIEIEVVRFIQELDALVEKLK